MGVDSSWGLDFREWQFQRELSGDYSEQVEEGGNASIVQGPMKQIVPNLSLLGFVDGIQPLDSAGGGGL